MIEAEERWRGREEEKLKRGIDREIEGVRDIFVKDIAKEV